MGWNRFPNDPAEQPHGMKNAITSLGKSVGGYLGARSELLAIESKEASQILRKKAKRLFIAGVLFLLGYLCLLIGLIGLIGQLLAGSELSVDNWIGGAGVMALLHFFPAFIFLILSRSGPPAKLFEYSRAEWEKDLTWLKNENKNS